VDKKAKALRIARKARGRYADGGFAAFGTQSPAEEGEDPAPVYRGIGKAVEHAVTLPYRYVKSMVDAGKTQPGSEEAHQAYGDVGATTGEMGMSMIGPKGGSPSTAGVFVGPYGAVALRNAAKESGNVAAEAALTHPVVGKIVSEEAAQTGMPADLLRHRGIVEQERRDDLARVALEAGKPDGPIWHGSGWERTTEGSPVKEIVDTGAKLLPIPGTDKFRLEHPAGDFHKAYDIPPISFDPNMKAGQHGYTAMRMYPDGRAVPDYIVLAGKPTQANVKQKVSTALHEVQHFIDSREGRVFGDPKANSRTLDDPLFRQEYFPGQTNLPFQEGANKSVEKMMKDPKKAGKILGASKDQMAQSNALFQTYLNNVGETRARNVQDRRLHSYKYLEKPEFTEDVSRGLQWKAGGGSVSNFNPERANAFGLSKQGLIKSSVPGRTDKLNMDVPSGSYVIPADVVSARGQGNTAAGASIMDKMFNHGPYGMGIQRSKAPRIGNRMTSLGKRNKRGFAEGGDTGQPTPIVAAGGEYVVHPETVASLGNGDINLGHDILDAFVKNTRAQHISTLKGLKPPKGSS